MLWVGSFVVFFFSAEALPDPLTARPLEGAGQERYPEDILGWLYLSGWTRSKKETLKNGRSQKEQNAGARMVFE